MKVGSRKIGAALVAASLLFTGCSDGTGPGEPFDPSHAQEDLTALGEMFGNEYLAALSDLSQYFDLEGGVPVMAMSSARAMIESGGVAPSTARKMANATVQALSLSRSAGTSPSFKSLPTEVLGKTFEFDDESESYVESDRTGAPNNGVRFIVYAIDPISQDPQVDSEVGYVDLIDLSPSSTTSVGLRMVLVSGSTTYLDYSFTASPGVNSAVLGVNGYLSDGTSRLDFDVDMNATFDEDGIGFGIDFSFSIPSRKFSAKGSVDVTDSETTQLAETDFTINSGGTKIRYDIVEDGATETVNATVYVNNRIFATITGEMSSPVIAGAEGAELTAEEENALMNMVEVAYASFFFLLQVMEPAANALGTGFLP